jgi:predicted DNA-binding protein YlxM (UPF0122 family)
MNYEKKYNEALERARGLHGTVFVEAQDLTEQIFPELRESEDERVLHFLKDQAIEWIASLEHDISQSVYDGIKGHDPEAEKELERWQTALAWLEKQKEQKPVQTSEEKEYIRTLKSLISDFIRDKQPADVIYYQRVYDWLDGRHIEQKPVEIHSPTDAELQRHQDELYDFKVFAAKQAKEHHISFVHDFEWNNFCAGLLSYFHEQKPAEWNEEERNEQV